MCALSIVQWDDDRAIGGCALWTITWGHRGIVKGDDKDDLTHASFLALPTSHARRYALKHGSVAGTLIVP